MFVRTSKCTHATHCKLNVCVRSLLFPQGNIVAIKYINRKRIELTRKVLFELKHVSVSCCFFSKEGLFCYSDYNHYKCNTIQSFGLSLICFFLKKLIHLVRKDVLN